MTKQDFIKHLETNCIAENPFNTNNVWGFGGAYGVKYYFPEGVWVKVGTACYRHTGTCKYIKLYGEGDYLNLSDTPKNRQRLINTLNKMEKQWKD